MRHRNSLGDAGMRSFGPAVYLDIMRVVDIRDLNAGDLEPLLGEQKAEWQRELDWDFSKTAAMVRKLAGERSLGGAALLDGREVVGFGYAGIEDYKGLIADVYVRPAWRDVATESMLFRVILDAVAVNPGIRRVEGQLMLSDEAVARVCGVRLFERLLMVRDADSPLPGGEVSGFEKWSDRHVNAAGEAVCAAYGSHIDSQIGDHYRTPEGARRYVRELIDFPGSSTFHAEASHVVFDAATGQATGLLLASFVAAEVGHIAELCVVPGARGAGLGYGLLRQSVAALIDAGARRISLAVTAANGEAVHLYKRCGFREVRRFYAFVWEASRSFS
jgi:ribosomal protein S18 acetylase RimI-like enzyme